MSLLRGRITLRVITDRHELEPVEPQDANDSGYVWAKRQEVTEFDLNPQDQRIWIDPEDVER